MRVNINPRPRGLDVGEELCDTDLLENRTTVSVIGRVNPFNAYALLRQISGYHLGDCLAPPSKNYICSSILSPLGQPKPCTVVGPCCPSPSSSLAKLAPQLARDTPVSRALSTEALVGGLT